MTILTRILTMGKITTMMMEAAMTKVQYTSTKRWVDDSLFFLNKKSQFKTQFENKLNRLKSFSSVILSEIY
jgi:hypothetical protein